ncbi:MAG: aspartate carbamoyltransferase [Spirochaetia bacterium]|nr:aspartate carbamoyltransferase [Spirochaetia bacterium]MCF7941322.1 aspartate carbamoyltransferase [Spirochaetia bacterium]
MRHEFKGRSLSVINDLSIAERRYLFAKTRELKEAIAGRDEKKLAEFRIDDPDFGIYEVFLEDSTRTRESFKNAAKFHRVKLSSLSTDSSSFNKGESYADTFNTLAGYDNSIFIIRSKLEGVCRWLEEAAAGYAQRNGLPGRPSFINAGDGKHEHPTQELLDEFTFLEDNDWSSDHLHIALAGDLFHGRTVHSKAHGLTVFDSVKVDLIAPPELAMPTYYTEIMKGHGFEVREFSSIEEYLAQDAIADKWYFTRPQLERMGDRILQRQEELRESITFAQRFLPLIPEHTRFYHPLPRHKGHPVIPTFLDTTSLNGWERQSSNGMLVRIVLLGLFSGRIGEDYIIPEVQEERGEKEDFIERVPSSSSGQERHYSEGVHPISDGIVIDHIGKGDTTGEIRNHMATITRVLGLHGKGGDWVSTSNKDPDTFKGIIFRPDMKEFDRTSLKRLAAIAPGSTLNIIAHGQVLEKYRLHLPPKIYNFTDLSCKNPNCISNPIHHEQVPAFFWKTPSGAFVCEYCGKDHTFKEIWN